MTSAESASQMVVRLVPAKLLLEGRNRGLGVDEQELAACHLGEIRDHLGADRSAQDGVMRTAGHQPGFGRGGQVRARLPHSPPDRQLLHRLLPWEQNYFGGAEAGQGT